MPITYFEDQRIFKIDSENLSYIFQVSEDDFLLHLYYGAKISDYDVTEFRFSVLHASFSPSVAGKTNKSFSLDTALQEYSCSGTGDMRISALQIKEAGGHSSTSLKYVGHKIYAGKKPIPGLPATYATEEEADSIEVYAEDAHSGARVTLNYSVFKNYNAIARSVRVENTSDVPFDIQRVYSACVDFYPGNYDMLHLYGSWAKERNIERRPIEHCIQSVQSKRGSSSHQHNPFVALLGHDTTEDFGDAYGFSVVYSGNFAIDIEQDMFGLTRVIAGINPAEFNWHLEPGESFYSPEVVMVYSNEGLGEMSRIYHRLYRNNLCRGEWKTKKRPILVNNWEGTYFDFDDEKIVSIARDAAELGIEMLVMDDGWFGERNDETTSLGDWTVNEKKIKCGLKKMVQQINDLGLKFGIWFEPEMISPISKLYEDHPDWCLHVPGRDRSPGRNQYVLDMTRADVRDYLFNVISAILEEANVEYIKWDFNRNLSEVGSALLPAERQQEVFHRYVLGLYELLERLLTAYPKLLLEGCSGGGGRFDPGMLYYEPQIWTSDDTDAIERLDIQYGTSIVYPPSTMTAHVSASPNHQTRRSSPFETRGNVAMAGSFGYELDLNQLTDEERELVRKQVADYHKYYDMINSGDYYRLVSPWENRYICAWEYVSQDKNEALLTCVIMRTTIQPFYMLKFKGLDPNKTYCDEATGKLYKGDTLMNMGMNLSKRIDKRDFGSIAVYIKAVD